MRRPLSPTDLPPDAPDDLRARYDEARESIRQLRAAERDVTRARENASTLVERYELALLRHRGQLTLFQEDT